jgi:uncharacterized protein YvpB
MKHTLILISVLLLLMWIPSIASAEENKHDYEIQNVPALSQYPELPTGCEATATAMLLQWAGADVTKLDVANALPKEAMPAIQDDGSYVGVNPHSEFIGDPFSDEGYGVFHEPIDKVIGHFLPGRSLDISGATFQELLDTVRGGKPVIVWATEQMTDPVKTDSWEDHDGNLVDWYEPEHALLMTGWDDDHVYMNDPQTGNRETYDLVKFKEVWEQMGSQAVTITDK